MGWVAAAASWVELARRLLKGDLVLKSQYELVVEDATKATDKADKAVDRQAALSEQTIASQAEVIKTLREGSK